MVGGGRDEARWFLNSPGCSSMTGSLSISPLSDDAGCETARGGKVMSVVTIRYVQIEQQCRGQWNFSSGTCLSKTLHRSALPWVQGMHMQSITAVRTSPQWTVSPRTCPSVVD